MKISRRSFLQTATAIGASLAWVGPARGSRVRWHERRDLYPQGVASGYAQAGSNDFGSAYAERKEIYDLVREAKITGFAIVSGDRHSFWAGYATAELPPRKFEPVGLSFVGASLASPGTMEALEHDLRKDHPFTLALSNSLLICFGLFLHYHHVLASAYQTHQHKSICF